VFSGLRLYFLPLLVYLFCLRVNEFIIYYVNIVFLLVVYCVFWVYSLVPVFQSERKMTGVAVRVQLVAFELADVCRRVDVVPVLRGLQSVLSRCPVCLSIY